MKLSELLTPDRIRVPLTSENKNDVLRELVSLLPDRQDPEVREQILQSVLDRENRMSTGIGMGVAIPHGKSDLVDGMEMTFGISRTPLDYDSLDGEPVKLFFLLISPPDHAGPHIKTLAQISRTLLSEDLREQLERASGPDEVIDLLRRQEVASDTA
jgi:fructose-specific phosphotransferase system IIA component